MSFLSAYFDSTRVQTPLETSSGPATIRIAQSEHAYCTDKTSCSARPPPSCTRAKLASPRAFCAVLRNFAATFQRSLRNFRSRPIADRLGQMRASGSPEVLGAPPAARKRSNRALTRQPRVGGTSEDATASLPAACGRPVTDKNLQNPRFASRSKVYNSRKPKVELLEAAAI